MFIAEGMYDTATGFEPVRLDNQNESGGGGTIWGVTGKDLVWSPDSKHVAAVGVMTKAGGKMGAAVWDAETGNRVFVSESNRSAASYVNVCVPEGIAVAESAYWSNRFPAAS